MALEQDFESQIEAIKSQIKPWPHFVRYSGVSHAVKSVRLKPVKNRQLKTKFDQLNSLFKL
jgi:hypothetical protein